MFTNNIMLALKKMEEQAKPAKFVDYYWNPSDHSLLELFKGIWRKGI